MKRKFVHYPKSKHENAKDTFWVSGEHGGVVFVVYDFRDGNGLVEYHHARQPYTSPGEEPTAPCEVTGGDCWMRTWYHGADEKLMPAYQSNPRDHDAIFALLEEEYRDHFRRLIGMSDYEREALDSLLAQRKEVAARLAELDDRLEKSEFLVIVPGPCPTP